MSEPGLRKKTPEDFERKKQLWNEVLKDNKGNIGGAVKKGTPQYEAMITKYKALLMKQTPPLIYAPSRVQNQQNPFLGFSSSAFRMNSVFFE